MKADRLELEICHDVAMAINERHVRWVAEVQGLGAVTVTRAVAVGALYAVAMLAHAARHRTDPGRPKEPVAPDMQVTHWRLRRLLESGAAPAPEGDPQEGVVADAEEVLRVRAVEETCRRLIATLGWPPPEYVDPE
jgi:hypothetical protein